MLSRKGTSKSTEEVLYLMIKLGLTLVVITLLVINFSDMELGCDSHNDNPSACIEDGNCRPESFEDDDGWNVTCNESVRSPDHNFNAAEDPDCFCPEAWRPIYDEESKNYGMCKKEDEYLVCQYTLEPRVPTN